MNEKKDSCYLCGFSRAVDRCHVFPRRILRNVTGFGRLKNSERNIVLLCKNHHFLFDHFNLEDEEWGKMILVFNKIIKETENFLNSDLKPKNGAATKKRNQRTVLQHKWYKDRLVETLVKYGLFERAK